MGTMCFTTKLLPLCCSCSAKMQPCPWPFVEGHCTQAIKLDIQIVLTSSLVYLQRSTVDTQTNTQILMLFFILLVLCVTSAVFNEIWTVNFAAAHWYLGIKGKIKSGMTIHSYF